MSSNRPSSKYGIHAHRKGALFDQKYQTVLKSTKEEMKEFIELEKKIKSTKSSNLPLSSAKKSQSHNDLFKGVGISVHKEKEPSEHHGSATSTTPKPKKTARGENPKNFKKMNSREFRDLSAQNNDPRNGVTRWEKKLDHMKNSISSNNLGGSNSQLTLGQAPGSGNSKSRQAPRSSIEKSERIERPSIGKSKRNLHSRPETAVKSNPKTQKEKIFASESKNYDKSQKKLVGSFSMNNNSIVTKGVPNGSQRREKAQRASYRSSNRPSSVKSNIPKSSIKTSTSKHKIVDYDPFENPHFGSTSSVLNRKESTHTNNNSFITAENNIEILDESKIKGNITGKMIDLQEKPNDDSQIMDNSTLMANQSLMISPNGENIEGSHIEHPYYSYNQRSDEDPMKAKNIRKVRSPDPKKSSPGLTRSPDAKSESTYENKTPSKPRNPIHSIKKLASLSSTVNNNNNSQNAENNAQNDENNLQNTTQNPLLHPQPTPSIKLHSLISPSNKYLPKNSNVQIGQEVGALGGEKNDQKNDKNEGNERKEAQNELLEGRAKSCLKESSSSMLTSLCSSHLAALPSLFAPLFTHIEKSKQELERQLESVYQQAKERALQAEANQVRCADSRTWKRCLWLCLSSVCPLQPPCRPWS